MKEMVSRQRSTQGKPTQVGARTHLPYLQNEPLFLGLEAFHFLLKVLVKRMCNMILHKKV